MSVTPYRGLKETAMIRKTSPRNQGDLQALALATAIALVTSFAGAQVQPNYSQNGHLLDKNPQTGSGGTNSPVAGYVPATGNQIINNNVTGTGGFHGPVPYRSEYEFGSVPGNSSVERFDQRSAGASGNTPYVGGIQTYYDPRQVV